MSARDARTLLLVVGMHRSGTSALCAALQAAGASFGGRLLDPMSGVNDEGFWEDEAVVDINERLLECQGLCWYTVPEDLEPVDWSLPEFEELRLEAVEIIQRGFGDAALEAVKDPRFCITLPFWLAAAESRGVQPVVCVINRAPLEVAASLQKRDGFPLGYGLHLYAAYRRLLALQVPAGTIYFTYDDLLRQPVQVIGQLSLTLPLDTEVTALEAVVKGDLRHQWVAEGGGKLRAADRGDIDLAGLAGEIESAYPRGAALRELAQALVERGREMTRVGEEHTSAQATVVEREDSLRALYADFRRTVATVQERDGQIEELDRRLAEAGDHLEQALQTIDERDLQIREFDHRLNEIGQMHSQALAHIDAVEAQLQRVFDKPVAGRVFRRMWASEDD